MTIRDPLHSSSCAAFRLATIASQVGTEGAMDGLVPQVKFDQ
jgi:hypothetical protein